MIGMLSLLMLGGTAIHAQQSREEVPGDHFSLEGALELFKKSSSPEEFERMLNSRDSEVNNLDLNGDGDIDYIKVIDRNQGNVHAFILQAIISDRESQDVAVIELEKLANGKAVLQITGDADIYGIETIIEPTEEVRVNAGTGTARTYVNVWAWPSVQYVYSPYYYGWVSPWSWSYWPTWWSPWRPVAYHYYYPRWEPYRSYYSVCHTHRVVYAQQIYRPYRNTSVIVYNRHRTQISSYRSRNDSYYNRDRSGGQGSRTTYDRTNDRQRPVTTERGNVNSSTRDWGRTNSTDSNSGRSTSSRNESPFQNRNTRDANSLSSGERDAGSLTRQELDKKSGFGGLDAGSRKRESSTFGNRSTYDNNRTTSGSQRNSNGLSTTDSQKRNGFENTGSASRQRESSSFGNRSSNDVNRMPSGRQSYERTNQGSSQREVRPSIDHGSQRSVGQPERRTSSGSGDSGIQRSGNGGGGNRSSAPKRGRD